MTLKVVWRSCIMENGAPSAMMFGIWIMPGQFVDSLDFAQHWGPQIEQHLGKVEVESGWTMWTAMAQRIPLSTAFTTAGESTTVDTRKMQVLCVQVSTCCCYRPASSINAASHLVHCNGSNEIGANWFTLEFCGTVGAQICQPMSKSLGLRHLAMSLNIAFPYKIDASFNEESVNLKNVSTLLFMHS